MLGQAPLPVLIANIPVTSFPSNSFPVATSRITGSIPKNGREQEPGFIPMQPGKGVSKMDPDSDCQYVSTTEHLPSPQTLKNQDHASGEMGSPTDPRTRSEERS